MKKLIIICLFLFLFTSNIKAATIEEAQFVNGHIVVSGTGTEKIQIVIFNGSKEPIYMTTDDVTNGKFNSTLPVIQSLVNGDYTIKVGDYNGENISEKNITIKNALEKNPKTSDNIIKYCIISIICFITLIGYGLYANNKKIN